AKQPVAGGVREAIGEDRGDEQIETPVAVDVGGGGAAAVLVGPDPGGSRPVEEATALVPEEACFLEVRCDREVGPPVAIEVGEADGEGERPRLWTRHTIEHDGGGDGGLLERAGTSLATIAEQVTDGAGYARVDRIGLQ